MITLGGFEHVHVTELESQHIGPCGANNAVPEDCFWVAIVEFLRATGRADIDASHAEAEAIRCAADAPVLGTSTGEEVRLGVRNRHHLELPPRTGGADAIWRALKPGHAAWVAGQMGSFTSDHWRRWQPGFTGGHATTVFRLSNADEVWWCDGLAPIRGTDPATGKVVSWNGELMPKKDFLEYANGAFVRPIQPTEGAVFPKIHAKIERWKLVGQPDVHVTTIGLPLQADDVTPDDSKRLAFFGSPALTAATPRFVIIERSRLTEPDASQDGALRTALMAYAVSGGDPAFMETAKLEGRRMEWDIQAAKATVQLGPKP